MTAILFWLCVAGIMTPYLIYPAWLYVLSRFRRVNEPGEDMLPVTFVISAFNESAVIAEKIKNTLALQYSRELMQIVVISDESKDGTDEIVAGFKEVELFRMAPRQGKSAGINRTFPHFRGDIIVFSDANAMYQSDAVTYLVRHFSDPLVGYVVGRQLYRPGESGVEVSENTYWNFELRLKEWESRLSSVVGGDGAIMAIRRDLYSPLSPDDINDFVLPLRIVAAGKRGRFEPRAVCYEESAPTFEGEFYRKIRIVSRSLRAVCRVPGSLNPFRVGIFAAQLFCHKIVRWMAFFLMIGALVTCVILATGGSRMYQVILMGQVAFYAVALLAAWTPVGRFKPATLIFYFCIANVAGALGVGSFLFGRRFATWTPQRNLTPTDQVSAR